jgi:hypothetical protein
MFKQRETGRIGPLHVVQKQDQRMVFRGKRANEMADYPLKMLLYFKRRQPIHRRLRPDDRFQLRHQVGQQPSIRVQSCLQLLLPGRDPCFGFSQHLPHQFLACVDNGGIGNTLLVLRELAGNEIAAFMQDRPMQFMHQHRLANAGHARDQYQCRLPRSDHAFERGPKLIQLRLTTKVNQAKVQVGRDQDIG